ncbi:hypothetical protein PR202_gb04291 [Eleusine coracana subsp. coracana]|uniref:Protein GPR107 n=1 Tax=Eleusine coracana subsp. coracana TaxID=191504 RepID=A0AAV5E477_ELECO|nr:hypothetical protein PR202_gb04291 [Eleusine coracana subsp. coracana]
MAVAAARALLLILAVAGGLLSPAAAEIKQESFKDDSRSSILFEKFGFSHHGSVYISVDGAKTSSPLAKPDLAQLGFFLLSDEALFEAMYEQQPPTDLNPNPESAPGCVLSSPYVTPLFTFAELDGDGHYNKTFPITHPDEYSLFFANCAPQTSVSMEVRTIMYNTNPDGTKDYLSVGQAPVPGIYAFFAVCYVVFLVGWLYVTLYRNRRLSAHRIPPPHDRPARRPYALLHLGGRGPALHPHRGVPARPFLQDKEKKVLMVVIPLQVAANIAAAVVGETGPFLEGWVTWNQIFLFVDVACCCAVLFPVVWSMRTLRESSKTDGKAARTLAKLTLFRQFYVVVIGYLYFTRIIVYALKTITNYKYRWVSVAAEEVATMAFYMFMFYMFRPAERNQYFALDDDEEEAAELALREEEFEL